MINEDAIKILESEWKCIDRNSHEERAWRLGVEDSIDLILAESEVEE